LSLYIHVCDHRGRLLPISGTKHTRWANDALFDLFASSRIRVKFHISVKPLCFHSTPIFFTTADKIARLTAVCLLSLSVSRHGFLSNNPPNCWCPPHKHINNTIIQTHHHHHRCEKSHTLETRILLFFLSITQAVVVAVD